MLEGTLSLSTNTVLFGCKICFGLKRNMRAIAGHAGKCGLKSRAKVNRGSHQCGHCTACFSTTRGLSIHYSRRHPGVKPPVKTSLVSNGKRSKSSWVHQDIETLKELLVTHGGQPGFYQLAAKQLPGRTADQIKYKAKKLKRVSLGNQTTSDEGSEWDNFLRNHTTTQNTEDPPDIVGGFLMKHAVGMKKEKQGADANRSDMNILKEEIDSLLRKLTKTAKQDRKGGRRNLARLAMSKPTKGSIYRKYQKLYHRNKSWLAKKIFEGNERAICQIPLPVVEEAFRGKWEKTDEFRSMGQFRATTAIDNSIFCKLISPEEVRDVRRKIKITAAPGPDGIRKAHIVAWDPCGTKTARIFNAILRTSYIPNLFKKNRTTLLPKTGDMAKLQNIGHWRPITIGCLMQRLMAGVVHVRMSKTCIIHERQRGFIPSPGCAENLVLLEGLIKLSKRERRSLAVVFIDFAKAFDSISHKHIKEVLLQRKIDKTILNYIQASYTGCKTRVSVGDKRTSHIKLKVGVKQGDPLSPLLFNLAIDPLLQKLEELGEGFTDGRKRMASLAFADDIVLLSSSWTGMFKNLKILETFCELTGLSLNAEKCHGFLIERSDGGMKINECPPWYLGKAKLHMIRRNEKEKYLGVGINPWVGIIKPDVVKDTEDILERLSKTPSKPTQKIKMLRTYGLPKLLYMADNGMVGKGTLESCDQKVRTAIKDWMHLHQSTTDGFIYAACKDGGLGISKLAKHVPATQFNRIVGLTQSSDPCTKEMARKTYPLSQLRKLSKWAGEEISPCGNVSRELPTELAKQKFKWAAQEFEKWAELSVQGMGIRVFKDDRISNHWLKNPSGCKMTEAQFILAAKLRTATYPTRTFLNWGRHVRKHGKLCRACGKEKETLIHITGSCIKLKKNRMRRHNTICNMVETYAKKKKWEIHREKHLRLPCGQLGVPDMIAVKIDTAIILDVTVRFETNGSVLEEAERVKKRKYTPFIAAVKKVAKRFSNRVLLNTISILKCFNKMAKGQAV
uniref:ribonuclease H n=1 Tax=Beryx splendens TaxID=88663 RepID=A0A1V1H2M9_BERSP|nr:reverse transcriptase [Beryx splendens]